MGRRFGDLADDIAARLPDREGLVFGASRYTFPEVAARIDEAARRLIAAGVGHGEHVALWLNNCDDWIFIAFAVQKIGAVLVPINTRFRIARHGLHRSRSPTRHLITHDRSGPDRLPGHGARGRGLPAAGDGRARPALPEPLRRVILLGEQPHAGRVDWDALAEPAAGVSADDWPAARAAPSIPTATAFIMYTSGTTGFPKGVMQRHNADPQRRGTRRPLAITADDAILNYLPLFHAFGLLGGALMSLVTGARQILTRRFDPERGARPDRGASAITIIHGFDTH